MAETGRVRVEVGFDGGQVMSAYVEPTTADQLEQALGGGGDGSFQIEAEDGRYTLALSRIVYVKRFSREGRVGFSGA
ncbi:MAG: hypothetical protein E6G45_01690 [Actinobacteria bacterium]|nr:MAG: hypothetical protein E6G45_01690 [Actinomycetota bacterium]